MTVVVGLTDLMSLAPASAEQGQFLQSVKLAAESLLRILDEAVDLSRLEVGALELNEGAFSLADVVAQAHEALSQTSAPIELAVAIDESVPPRLVGDADRVRQVLVALARSAGKFRTGRAYQLRISAGPALEGKLILHFALGDPERTFEACDAHDCGGQFLSPAYFAERGYAGPGLALPVAAGLAQLMGGHLWMTERPDSPVLFRLMARFGLPDSRRHADFLAAVEEELALHPPGAPLRLLLAEDTIANHRFFTSVLAERGHKVVAVSNGQEALRAFGSHGGDTGFDLALIDLEMPVMNGWQTAAALRQLDAFRVRPVPLVALTAHRTDAAGELAHAPLFDAAITKPCELGYFYRVIETLARGSKSAGDPVTDDALADSPSSKERVDYRGTLRRLGGNRSLFCDLVRFYLEDAPVVLAALASALERRDPPSVERAAHSLKGLVANFGARDAALLAADLQRLGHEGDLSEAVAIYEQLEREVHLARRELEGYQTALQSNEPNP